MDQYSPKQIKIRTFVSQDDHEIDYFREEKIVPKIVELKEIQHKLIQDNLYNFKNRDNMLKKMQQ